MIRLHSVDVERWPVAGSFNIARGAKTHVDVVLCTLTDGTRFGRGEGTAIYYHGETAQACAAQIEEAVGGKSVIAPGDVLSILPPGAARNALDCAMWDLRSQQAAEPVWRLAGLPEPQPLPTAYTISLDEPSAMAAAAKRASAAGFGLLKCKLTGSGDRERVAAVRLGAPAARLIVDANESWAELDVLAEAKAMADLGVTLIEQPLPARGDANLAGMMPPVPFCADESCQSRAELASLGGYQAINIKLDKAGGFTEALALAREARKRGFRLMVGCMLGTSLGMAPAFLIAQLADWVDLDGALLLERDREGALPQSAGMLRAGTLWGNGTVIMV
jgi:L-Ala-D/L-Glu epimerase